MNSFALQWPEGTDLNDPVLLPLYDIEAMTGVETYSDLEYEQVELTIGGSYAFTPALFASAEVGVDYFNDRAPYVYGWQDGTVYRGSVGVGYRF